MTQDNNSLADIAGSTLIRMDDTKTRTFIIPDYADINFIADRLIALDTLISDVRNGVVKIVPVEATDEMIAANQAPAVNLGTYLTAESSIKRYAHMLSAAPDYEPIKPYLGDKP